jgi:hypothetical protein
MKVREGFVSNSSSSSFVVFATKENYDRVYESANPLMQAVANAVKSDCRKFLGHEMVSLATINGNISTWEYTTVDYNGEIPPEYDSEWMDYSEILDDFVKLLGDDVLTHSEDF